MAADWRRAGDHSGPVHRLHHDPGRNPGGVRFHQEQRHRLQPVRGDDPDRAFQRSDRDGPDLCPEPGAGLCGRVGDQRAGTQLRRAEKPGASAESHRLRVYGRVGCRHRQHPAVAGWTDRLAGRDLLDLPAVSGPATHDEEPRREIAGLYRGHRDHHHRAGADHRRRRGRHHRRGRTRQRCHRQPRQQQRTPLRRGQQVGTTDGVRRTDGRCRRADGDRTKPRRCTSRFTRKPRRRRGCGLRGSRAGDPVWRQGRQAAGVAGTRATQGIPPRVAGRTPAHGHQRQPRKRHGHAGHQRVGRLRHR